MAFTRYLAALALATVQAIVSPAHAAPALEDVRSYLYLVFSQTRSPGIYDAIRAAPHDMIILGVQHGDPPLDRALADPAGRKLILGYANLTLGATWQNPDLFVNGAPPSWFGNQDPDWPANYSVQFWNPGWLDELTKRIDVLIADGYDGVLLDSASGDFAWTPGNPYGNPVYPSASRDLGTLLIKLKAHVQAKRLAKPFYIVPNDPIGVAQNYPAALSALDGIFAENLYFNSTGVGGLNTSIERSADLIHWIENNAGRIYGTLGIPIFGNDYPQPVTNRALALKSFLLHNKFGWVPSVVKAEAMVDTIASGPHMFMATPGNPVAIGTPTLVNYLAGGKANPATLVGGQRGDYFIGGQGVNIITAGAGDDVIYPHPRRAVLQQTLRLTLQSIVVGNRPTPKVSVLLNGSVKVPTTTITALQPATQDVVFDVPRGQAVTSVVLIVTDAEYIDAQNFSNGYYAGTGNYVATSSADDRLWLLGPATGNVVSNVGDARDYEAAAGCSP
jgi:endo-alpha-1,4-polygalactosaminidase (GH114 family)